MTLDLGFTGGSGFTSQATDFPRCSYSPTPASVPEGGTLRIDGR